MTASHSRRQLWIRGEVSQGAQWASLFPFTPLLPFPAVGRGFLNHPWEVFLLALQEHSKAPMEEHFHQWLQMLLSSVFKVLLRESSRLFPSDRLFPCQSRTNKIARAVWGHAPGSSWLVLEEFRHLQDREDFVLLSAGLCLPATAACPMPAPSIGVRCCQVPPPGVTRNLWVLPGVTRCNQESLGTVGARCCLLRPQCPRADKRFAAAFQP